MKRCKLHYLFRKTNTIFSFTIYFTVFYAIMFTPAFGQGKLEAKKLGTTKAPWGYYEYLPDSYNQKSKHPVIIFLEGIGEKGNGKSDLDKVLKHGPPKLIKKGEWPSSRPFLVFAPQSATDLYNKNLLHDFINYIINNYKVDASRIYLTGLSGGGISIWNYLAAYPKNSVAAVVPISGSGKNDVKKACSWEVPIWAFHGSSDPTIGMDGSVYPVETINGCSSKPLAKVTIYPGVKHDAWSRTYDLSGMKDDVMSKYSPYKENIYDWMLKHSKDGSAPPPPAANQPPVAQAGNDVSAAESDSKVVLNGSGSSDKDGKITSYYWKKLSGPKVSLSGAGSSQLTLTKLSKGTYKFRLTVKDDDDASDSDEISVTVSSKAKPKPEPKPDPKPEPTPDPVAGGNGLNYKYYEGSWSKLPDFSKQKIVKSGIVANFSLSPRNKSENFGFLFEGYIKIDTKGEYTFFTSSDDGSELHVNSKQVVWNNGLHGNQERSGKIWLSAGYHYIKVKYFEYSGSEILEVKYAGPGIKKQSIPANKLFTAQGGNDSPAPSGPPPSSPPPSDNGTDEVARLYLINPDTNKEVGELKSGSEIVKGSGFNIKAETDPGKVGSVKFVLNDKTYRIENAAPYAMGGDSNGNFGAMDLAPGTYTLKAIPYDQANAKGKAGEALQMEIKVVKGKKVTLNARVDALTKTILPTPENEETKITGVFPNPVEDQVHIQFAGSGPVGDISCRILNYTGAGREVKVGNEQFFNGELLLDVSQWNLSAGVYLLQVTYNQGQQQVFRIIKK